MLKPLEAWLNYIGNLHTSRIDLGLQRIHSIVEEQNFKHFPCPVIIVAGTNGKGSCIRILEGIYSAAGYRVGAYYSPHLYRFNERICIAQQEVDDKTLLAAFARVEAFRQDRPLSFFEFTTLAALSILRSRPLDVVLLEVGLGGRLDAVNVVEPDVSIVTSVGLDHLDWLGSDRDSIGYEKAGVYRTGKPAICGDFDPPQRLINYAHEINAKLIFLNKAFQYEVKANYWNWSCEKSQYRRLPLPNLKCQNAATSLMAIDCLQSRLRVNENHIQKGLKNNGLSGRFEVFSKQVKGILDVAHNPDSTRWLATQIERADYLAKKIAVVGMLKDKDIPRTLEPLIPLIDMWFVGGLQTERSANPQEIVQYLKALGVENCYNFCTVSNALKQAIQACSDLEDRVIAFGSFYTVAEVKAELDKEV